ncbi:MAG: MFS transporter [Caldimonas sp.]
MRPTASSGVGAYLGVVQFFFALCWTVYVIFLPRLALQAGIPKQAVIWILMLDQLVFVLVDYTMGVASDRLARVVGQIGHFVLGVTVLSCVAFLALPFVAPQGSPTLFLAVVVLWSASTSALRAPPLTLIGRHAARPNQPWLVALSLLGLGAAGAIAPYLAVHLRGIDPRVPFVLSSAALVVTTLGIVAAERALARASSSSTTLVGQPAPVSSGATTPGLPTMVFVLPVLFAALAFQVHASLNSEPLYLRLATPAEMPFLAPVFWIGFNLFMLPATLATRRWPALRVMGAAGFVAAAAALAAQHAGSLALLIAAQCIAGAAWAALLLSAFAAALELGRSGREGRFSGALSSVLAGAALLRMAVIAFAWHKESPLLLQWLPVVAWLLAGGALLAIARPRAPT